MKAKQEVRDGILTLSLKCKEMEEWRKFSEKGRTEGKAGMSKISEVPGPRKAVACSSIRTSQGIQGKPKRWFDSIISEIKTLKEHSSFWLTFTAIQAQLSTIFSLTSSFISNPKFSVSLHNDFSQICIIRLRSLIGELRSSMAKNTKQKRIKNSHTPLIQIPSFSKSIILPCSCSLSLFECKLQSSILINILYSYQLNFLNVNSISLKFQYFGCPMSW